MGHFLKKLSVASFWPIQPLLQWTNKAITKRVTSCRISISLHRPDQLLGNGCSDTLQVVVVVAAAVVVVVTAVAAVVVVVVVGHTQASQERQINLFSAFLFSIVPQAPT